MNMQLVMSWFSFYLPMFFVQIVTGEAVLAFRLNRRKLFWVRAGGGLLASAAFLFLVAMLASVLLAASPVLVSFIYIIVFLWTVALLAFCFKESFGTLLFCGVAAYALHTFSYRLFGLIELTGFVRIVTDVLGNHGYLLLFHSLFALIMVGAYFLFIRNINRKNIARVQTAKVIAISTVLLLVSIFLSDWINRVNWQSLELTIICDIFSCLCSAFILCLQSGMLQQVGYQQELEVVNELWKQDRRQYELSRESIDLINVKCHDLRFIIQTLRKGNGVPDDELAEIENAISTYDGKANTGCEPLDTILTENSLYCQKNGITLTCMTDASKLSFISSTDLYSLVGNILSNAVEATVKIPDVEKRIINFQVKQVGNLILVAAQNYFVGSLDVQDGVLISHKEDRQNHGYGMKSIRMLVKKYNGGIDIQVHDNVFYLQIYFPSAA